MKKLVNFLFLFSSVYFFPLCATPLTTPIAIQLFDVCICNDTGIILTVIDTIRGPWGERNQRFNLRPTEQRLIQWRGIISVVVTREISIQGAAEGATGLTNKIIIGNTNNATLKPGGMVPGGSYTIERPNTFFISASVNGALDAGGMRFTRALQIWDTYIKNNSGMLLTVIDEIDGPQGHHRHKETLRDKEVKIFSWNQGYSSQKTRKIIVYGSCNGAGKPTNVIVIGNTHDANFNPEGGTQGGEYVITRINECTLAATPSS